jgi:hypothetical protein
MIDAATLNAKGVRTRQALDILRTTIKTPQQALSVAYAYATFSNLMRALEEDAGVFPGYFGSAGPLLPEVNPFDGVVMPAAVSGEPAPPFNQPKQAGVPAAPPFDTPTPTLNF